MNPLTYQKEVRTCIGVINYYQNMWPRWSHALSPLARLTYIKNKFKWTQVEQDAFGKTKRIVECDTLLTYPDFNEEFKIHTDTSAIKLGSVIIQKG